MPSVFVPAITTTASRQLSRSAAFAFVMTKVGRVFPDDLDAISGEFRPRIPDHPECQIVGDLPSGVVMTLFLWIAMPPPALPAKVHRMSATFDLLPRRRRPCSARMRSHYVRSRWSRRTREPAHRIQPTVCLDCCACAADIKPAALHPRLTVLPS
jgi:hypothetical protein